MGRTSTLSAPAPVATISRRGAEPADAPDGYVVADDRVWGCYLHGLFTNPDFRRAWLRSLG